MRNSDAFISAKVYTSQEAATDSTVLDFPYYQGLRILDRVVIAEPNRPNGVQELAIDATYGTNSAGHIYSVCRACRARWV